MDNPYNPNPITVDSSLRQQQTALDWMGKMNNQPAETPVVPQPQEQPSVLGVNITPDYQGKSFFRKVGEDAAMLAYSIPTGIAQILTHPIKFAEALPGALVESVKQTVDPSYYQAHPLLGAVNLAGFVSPIAGLAKSMAIKTATNTVIDIALREAATSGVEKAVLETALHPKIIGNVVQEAVKTGKTNIVKEVISNALTKVGVPQDAALLAGYRASDNLAVELSRQSTKMDALQTIAHPVSTINGQVSKVSDPVKQAIFGDPANAAVSKIFGAAEVAKNPEGALQLEKWAEVQVAEQRLKNTVENRLNVIMEWKTKPRWAGINTIDAAVQDFGNYTQGDIYRSQISKLTGQDYVTTLALPKNLVDSMVATVQDSLKTDINDILKTLEDNYPAEYNLNSAELKQALKTDPTKEGLINAITKLGDSKSLVTFNNVDPQVLDLVKKLEATGYRLAYAPRGKKISYASEIAGGMQNVPQDLQPLAQEARKYKSAEEFVNKMYIEPSYDLTPGITRLTKQKTTGLYHGTSPEAMQGILNTGKIKAKITKLDKIGQKSVSVTGSKGVAGSYGSIIFELDPKLKVVEPPVGAVKGFYYKGFEFRYTKDIPINKIKSAFIDIGKTETLDTKMIVGWEGRKPIYKSISEIKQQLEAKGIKTYVANLGDKSQLTDIWNKANQTPEIPPQPSQLTTQDILTHRTAIGQFLDRVGLSPRGVPENIVGFNFKENFNQHILSDFAAKYGDKIKIGNITMPIEKIYDWIDRNRFKMMEARPAKGFTINTVFDVQTSDLVRAGFSPDVADSLVAISKQARREIPPSLIGMGDAVVNYLITFNNGFGKYASGVYYKYLQAAYKGRYDWSPFFSAQQYLETRLFSSMLLKDVRTLPGMRGILKLGNWTADKLGIKLFDTKEYLSQALAIPKLEETALVKDAVFGNSMKGIMDVSNPDMMQIQNSAMGGLNALKDKALFERSIRSRNIWYSLFGQSNMRMATNFVKALSYKFGMTLEEALSYNIENGQMVFKNPEMVQMIREATQSIYHYQTGFLTSPLMKTMNMVWFPLRFQVKSVQLVANWMKDLSPYTQMALVNDWVHFANWAGTDEGIKWRWTNRNYLYNILAYATAWEQLGQTAEAVTNGRLFGGNAGLIGGVPFGFLVNVARELAVLPQDPDQFDPKTGQRFQKSIPRNVVSAATLSTAIEQLLISMSPSTPFYSLTGGVIGGVSPSKITQSLVRQVVGATREAAAGRDPAKGRQMLERDFKKVPLDYTRLAK